MNYHHLGIHVKQPIACLAKHKNHSRLQHKHAKQNEKNR